MKKPLDTTSHIFSIILSGITILSFLIWGIWFLASWDKRLSAVEALDKKLVVVDQIDKRLTVVETKLDILLARGENKHEILAERNLQ